MKKEEKSKELFKKGKVELDMKSDERLYFIVDSNKEHSVIFDKNKDWMCDCKFYSLRQGECSHIKACQIFLKQKNGTKKEG